jgi:hypothetical protein
MTRGSSALLAAWLLVVVATLYPRLALLGGLPFTDEGFYGFEAQAIHDSIAAGMGLPDHGMLNLYPMLVSWVFSTGGSPLLLWRIVDMLVAVCVGWLLFRLASRESGDPLAGAVIAAVFSFAMNQQAFVQYGFRNSIFAAYIPLLLAALIGLDPASREKDSNWWLCGALVALGVLLRETLVYFAVLGFVAVLVAHGWRSAARYALGGVLAGGAVIALVALARGGVAELAQSYSQASDTYVIVADMRWQWLDLALSTAAIEGAVALPLALAGLAAVGFAQGDRAPYVKRWVFWLAVAIVPMVEPILKIGYAYHVAVSAIGLCGLAALAWRALSGRPRSIAVASASVLLAGSAILGWVQIQKLNVGLDDRVANVRALAAGDWPKQAIPQSNYLLLAEAMRKADPAARTLAVSGGALILFPLTGMAPSSYALHDLSDLALKLHHDGASLRRTIAQCPPDILMVTSRPQKLWGRDAIIEALSGMPEYVQVANVPIARDQDFRAYPGGRSVEHAPSGSIYRRAVKSSPCRA